MKRKIKIWYDMSSYFGKALANSITMFVSRSAVRGSRAMSQSVLNLGYRLMQAQEAFVLATGSMV